MNKLSILNRKLSKGFTLIELLIVIAVLGVLAAVVLVAIDPIEQFARGRDAGRKSSNVELGRAMEANFTNNGSYIDPAAVGNWVTSLQAAGDIKTPPSNPAIPATPCTGGEIALGSQYCLKLDITAPTNPRIIIYIKTESKSEASKCGGVTANTWSAYLSAWGRGGTFCKAPAVGEPAAADAITLFAP